MGSRPTDPTRSRAAVDDGDDESPPSWAPTPWWQQLAGGGIEPPSRLVIGLVAVAAVAVVVIIVVVVRSGRTTSLDDRIPHIDDIALPTITAAEVHVHIAGAVAEPGVYRLAAGDRVADLVEAAGGLTADAQPDLLNLAAVLSDGSQVYVPRVGDETIATSGGGSAGVGGAAAVDGDPTIDVNVADAAELESLPGIGPSLAAAIVRHRETHGPFATLDDLIAVAGIGPAKLEGLRDAARV